MFHDDRPTAASRPPELPESSHAFSLGAMVTSRRRGELASWVSAMGLGSLGFELFVLRARMAPHDLRIFLMAAQRLVQGHSLYQLGFVSPPEWAVVLLPLAPLAFWIAATIFISTSAAALVWASWRGARWFGLRPLPTAGAVLGCPVGWWGLMLGQPDALLTAALLELTVALGTRRWWLAGLITPWLLLKPDVTWPVAVFVPIALLRDRSARRSYFKAALLSSVVFLLLGGWWIPDWVSGLARFGQHSQFQPVLSGLPDLVGGELGAATPRQILTSPLGLAATMAGLVAMALVAARAGHQLPTPERAVWMAALPLAIWVAASPYVHDYDMLFLLPLCLLLVARGPEWSAAVVGMATVPLVVFPTLGALGAIAAAAVAAAGAAAIVIQRPGSLGRLHPTVAEMGPS